MSPSDLNPHEAAYWALIAICLVAVGATLTGDVQNFSIAERGTVLGAVVAILGYVGWRSSKRRRDE